MPRKYKIVSNFNNKKLVNQCSPRSNVSVPAIGTFQKIIQSDGKNALLSPQVNKESNSSIIESQSNKIKKISIETKLLGSNEESLGSKISPLENNELKRRVASLNFNKKQKSKNIKKSKDLTKNLGMIKFDDNQLKTGKKLIYKNTENLEFLQKNVKTSILVDQNSEKSFNDDYESSGTNGNNHSNIKMKKCKKCKQLCIQNLTENEHFEKKVYCDNYTKNNTKPKDKGPKKELESKEIHNFNSKFKAKDQSKPISKKDHFEILHQEDQLFYSDQSEKNINNSNVSKNSKELQKVNRDIHPNETLLRTLTPSLSKSIFFESKSVKCELALPNLSTELKSIDGMRDNRIINPPPSSNQKSKPIDPKEDVFLANYSITASPILIPYCSLCNSTKSVTGFLCNHNICIECLTLQCSSNIYQFLYTYQTQPDAIFKEFSYICPIFNCLGKISVPTIMVLENLRNFLKNPDTRQKFLGFECIFGLIELWIPYFDGLSASLVYF